MFLIENDVIHWGTQNTVKFPTNVNIYCPYCGRFVHFVLQNFMNVATGKVADGPCPACKKSPQFFYIYSTTSKGDSGLLFVHPDPANSREPLADLATLNLGQRLQNSYQEAIKAYNAGIWSAAGFQCRRILEGLVKSLTPEGHRLDKNGQPKKLYTLLNELPSHQDLSKPIKDLADGLREGGNIASHFDEELEHDQESVTMMLDMLDDLIDYLYRVPQRTSKLRERFARSSD